MWFKKANNGHADMLISAQLDYILEVNLFTLLNFVWEESSALVLTCEDGDWDQKTMGTVSERSGSISPFTSEEISVHAGM